MDRHQKQEDQLSHQDRLRAEAARQAPDNAAMQANIKRAQAGLAAALAEQKASGRDEAEALRKQKPIFPQIALREPDFLWDAATVAKFREAQATQLEAYYENLLQAESGLLSADDLRRLPAAIKFLDTRNKLAIQAGAEASARIAEAQSAGKIPHPNDVALVQKAQAVEAL